MVCRKYVTSWNQALSGPVIGAGDFSVSQVAWYQMNYALQNPPGQYISADDAGPAHDKWMADPTIPCAVLWEPWISGNDQVKGALTVDGAIYSGRPSPGQELMISSSTATSPISHRLSATD